MKKPFLIIFTAFFVSFACSCQTSFSQNSSTLTTPARFAEGVVETPADEYNPTFTHDGKTVFFTRRADRKGKETIMF